jgi:hypothetical protein
MSYEFCEKVYLLYQIQQTSSSQVVAGLHAVMSQTPAPDASEQLAASSDLNLHNILSRDIDTYAPFNPGTINANDPASFFHSMYVHLSAREARTQAHPHVLDTLRQFRDTPGYSESGALEDVPSIPAPLSSLLTQEQAMRVLAVSGVNVTVSAGILLRQGVSVWQVATHLSLIKASIVQNIQRMLSAVEVTDFTVAEITEYSVACQDGTLDLSRETDVDCGGDDTRCVRCDGGLKCETDSDCLSLQCDNLVCAAPRKLRRNEWFVSE